jgi:hypothetical protein
VPQTLADGILNGRLGGQLATPRRQILGTAPTACTCIPLNISVNHQGWTSFSCSVKNTLKRNIEDRTILRALQHSACSGQKVFLKPSYSNSCAARSPMVSFSLFVLDCVSEALRDRRSKPSANIRRKPARLEATKAAWGGLPSTEQDSRREEVETSFAKVRHRRGNLQSKSMGHTPRWIVQCRLSTWIRRTCQRTSWVSRLFSCRHCGKFSHGNSRRLG